MMEQKDFDLHINNMLNANIIAVDTETTGIDGIKSGQDYLMGISVSYGLPNFGTISEYFPYRHEDETGNLDRSTIAKLDHVFSSRPLVFHNRKFDLHSLHTIGINLDRCTNPQYDTMIIVHMLDEELYSKELDYLAKMFLNDQKDKSELEKWTKIMGWASVPIELMKPYAKHDTELTLNLFKMFWPRFVDEELDQLWPVEQEYNNILYRMEQEAVKLDG